MITLSTRLSIVSPPSSRCYAAAADHLRKTMKHNRKMLRYHNEMQPQLTPEVVKDSRYMQVCVLGVPNAGKSVLTNSLVGHDVCASSSKPNTTRRNTLAQYTEGNTQIMLMDTPGVLKMSDIVKRKEMLDNEPTLSRDYEVGLRKAHLIMAVVDVSERGRTVELHPRIQYQTIPSILVLNKVDTLIKDRTALLSIATRLTAGIVGGEPVAAKKEASSMRKKRPDTPLTDATHLDDGDADDARSIRIKKVRAILRDRPMDKVSDRDVKLCFHGRDGWPHFDDVFFTSGVTGTGVQPLRSYLLTRAPPGQWRNHSSVVTNKPPPAIIVDSVRAALLDALPAEIPYTVPLLLTVNELDDDSGARRCLVEVHCATEAKVRKIVGVDGKRIQQIAKKAEQAISNALSEEIYLRIVVQVHKDIVEKKRGDRSMEGVDRNSAIGRLM